MTQLTLIAAPPKLTERQQAALDHIRANQPIASEELGAFLHEERRDRGGRGHDRESRCRYCQGEGAQTARALRRQKLVVHRQKLGWCTPDYKPDLATSSQNAVRPGFDEHGLPAGF